TLLFFGLFAFSLLCRLSLPVKCGTGQLAAAGFRYRMRDGTFTSPRFRGWGAWRFSWLFRSAWACGWDSRWYFHACSMALLPTPFFKSMFRLASFFALVSTTTSAAQVHI